MNCHECALQGEEIPAVGTCRQCGVGLCFVHLRAAASYRVGGTLYGCPHDPSATPLPAHGPEVNGRRRASVLV